VYDFVSELTLEADAVLTTPDVEFIKTWLLVAGQYTTGEQYLPKDHVGPTAYSQLLLKTRYFVFLKWAKGVLISNIGAGDVQQNQGTPSQQGQQQQQ
jgi:hypothetical protein